MTKVFTYFEVETPGFDRSPGVILGIYPTYEKALDVIKTYDSGDGYLGDGCIKQTIIYKRKDESLKIIKNWVYYCSCGLIDSTLCEPVVY